MPLGQERPVARAPMLGRTTRQLCGQLPPYNVVAAIVCGDGRMCGIALSDPYLSCATAFAQVEASPCALQRALEGMPVGGLLLGLPMIASQRDARLLRASCRRRHRLSASLLRFPGGVGRLPFAYWDARQSINETRRLHYSDALWDALDLSDLTTPSGTSARPDVLLPTHAAVSLQSMLFDYCDGWPNTFG